MLWIELVPLGIEKVLHYPGEPLAVKVGGLFVVSPPKPLGLSLRLINGAIAKIPRSG